MKELFPVGTVVKLKDVEKNMMITGILQQVEDGKSFDYMGVPHPEGYLDEDTVFVFNNDDIEKVEFIGFINAEFQMFMKTVNEKLAEEENTDDNV